MSFVKRVLCLANSRKMSGRCVAGKEALGTGWGAWIRPVSGREHEELSEEERRYEDGTDPEIGDVIEVPLLEHRPRAYQQENYLIDDTRHWVRSRRAMWSELDAALDPEPQVLWQGGYSSSNGLNDRIPEERAGILDRSLYLLKLRSCRIQVQAEWEGKRQVRAEFSLGAHQHLLKVTDPVTERDYLRRANGRYPLDDVLLCLSLGEPFQGFAYKLVATVITRDRIGEGTP
jgi:hypothetical protein